MTWPHKLLSEILDQSGHHRAGDQELPVLSITMKHGLVDQADKFKKRIASSDTSNYRIAYKNELVVGFPIDEGVLGFQTKYPAGVVSPAYDIWKLKDGAACHIPFLERYLRSPEARSLYASRMQGAVARRRSLTKTDFLGLEIPFPKLDDQIRIAHLLGKAERLIAKRKQHLKQLDDLLTSIFVGMFGDIPRKKSAHPWVALRPYLKANSGKSSKNVTSRIETGIPIYGGNGVTGWATEALYEVPVVIVGRVGQQCGVTHISKGPSWVTDNAIVLSITDDSKLDIVYLAKAFHYAPIRERVKQLDLPFINQSMLLDYPLPFPPIDLQREFAAIVGMFEGVKSSYHDSLIDLEVLYGALSQLAFKGELNLSRIPLSDEGAEYTRTDISPPPTESFAPTGVEQPPMPATALQRRDEVLDGWLRQHLANTSPYTGFDSAQMLEDAWQALQAVRLDEDGDSTALNLAEYDILKELIFKVLDTGELLQTFDDEGNRVSLRTPPAGGGTW